MVKKKLEQKKRTPRGSVAVEVYRGHFRLRWRYQSGRLSLYTGIPVSVVGRRVAETKANQVELDILSGNFDPSLKNYRAEDPEQPKPDELIKKTWGRLEQRHDPSEESLLKHLQGWVVPF
ncbi:MAG: hypothetical protein OHK0012_21680 [Synechococcales cyanobacterium]